MLDSFWRQGMQSGHRNAYECIAAFSATDFRGDLARFDVPTLVIHGDDRSRRDQPVCAGDDRPVLRAIRRAV